MEEYKVLSKIGLSEKEALVYLVLLEMGEASMTDIAQNAQLKRPTVYLIVESLNVMGLASIVVKGKKKMYSAAHPRRIAELLRFRENQFQEIFPLLIARQGSVSGKPKVQMFEGVNAVRDAYRDALTTGPEHNEVLWFGNMDPVLEKFPEIVREYQRLLRTHPRLHVRELTYGEENSKKWVEEMQRKKAKNYQVRYFDTAKSSLGITDQCIVGDKIMLFSLSAEIFMLIIESKELAKTYRGIFDLLWNIR